MKKPKKSYKSFDEEAAEWGQELINAGPFESRGKAHKHLREAGMLKYKRPYEGAGAQDPNHGGRFEKALSIYAEKHSQLLADPGGIVKALKVWQCEGCGHDIEYGTLYVKTHIYSDAVIPAMAVFCEECGGIEITEETYRQHKQIRRDKAAAREERRAARQPFIVKHIAKWQTCPSRGQDTPAAFSERNRLIREAHKDGLTLYEIKKIYGVSFKTIGNILNLSDEETAKREAARQVRQSKRETAKQKKQARLAFVKKHSEIWQSSPAYGLNTHAAKPERNRLMREAHKDGLTLGDLAKMYGLARNTIDSILNMDEGEVQAQLAKQKAKQAKRQQRKQKARGGAVA